MEYVVGASGPTVRCGAWPWWAGRWRVAAWITLTRRDLRRVHAWVHAHSGSTVVTCLEGGSYLAPKPCKSTQGAR